MKQLIGKDTGTYTFNASAQTVVFSGVTITQEQILTVVNTTDGIMIYCFADNALGGSLSSSTLTLTYNTTSMSNTDKLQIYVDMPNVVQSTSLSTTTIDSLTTAESTILLRRILKVLESNATVDSSQRQRIVVDSGAISASIAATQTLATVTNVGTLATLTSLSQISGIDTKLLMSETSRNSYSNGIRSKLTW